MFFLNRFVACSLLCSLFTFSYADVSDSALAEALGWVNTLGAKNCNACGGYYDLSQFPAAAPMDFKAAPVTINASPPVHYQLNGNVEFQNGVHLSQPGRTLYADHAVITPNLHTGRLDAISADGNIRLAQPDELLLARSIQADLVNYQAQAVDVAYLIRVGETSPTLKASQPIEGNFTGFARGTAAHVAQSAQNKFSLSKATYSTCSPLTRTWELDANSIDIDQAEGRGEAYNTSLKVHGIPLLYLPYFSFPTSGERKSGFLYGNITGNTANGLSLSAPYYFNLAPNYDDTLTPTLYTKRGILFDNNVRFLTESSSGNIDTQVLPYDQADNSIWRYAYTINDTTNFTPNLTGNVNYYAVSDDNYLQDFSVLGANQTLLNRSGSLNYQNEHWNFFGLLQSYQILNNTLTTQNTPYNELPALNLTGQYPNLIGPFDFSLGSNLTNFTKSGAPFEVSPVEATRLNVTPSVSLPLTQSYGYLTPTVSFDSTNYVLTNAIENGFPDNTPSFNIPIFDIDSSLYFDRNFDFHNAAYSQTLSPRLFYLYVPYENQNTVPIFDTSIVPFSYNQLFSTNSFSGYDRVQEANQIAYALSTNINNATGAQVLSAGIGQIWYFASRNVSICQNQPNSPPCVQIENPEYNDPFSDLAAYFTYNFNPTWNFEADATYNPNDSSVDSQSYGVTYTPNDMDVLYLGYQNNLQNYSLLSTQQVLAGTPPPASSIINTAFVWGLTPKWAVFGSVNFSLEGGGSGPIAEFGGIQYSSCCWAVRIGDYRYVINNNPNTPNVLTGEMTSTFMVQFLLKGLGGASSGQIASLLSTIPTYHGQLGF